MRRLADDPRVAALAPDLAWDSPLRLLAGMHHLVLGTAGGLLLALDRYAYRYRAGTWGSDRFEWAA